MLKNQTEYTISRGTDIPGQGSGVEVTGKKMHTVSRTINSRGTDIPGQSGGVSGCPAGKFNPCYPKSWCDVTKQCVIKPRRANSTTSSIRSVCTGSGIAHVR